MPLTLNVGISKKIGLPDYGSVGAVCNVTVELDAAILAQDSDGFQRHVRNAYAACAQAVSDELARQTANPNAGSNGHSSRLSNNGGTVANEQTNGSHAAPRTNGNGNGNGGHPASEKQMNFVNQLSRGIRGLGRMALELL